MEEWDDIVEQMRADKVPLKEQASIMHNYFNSEMRDDEFNALAPEQQKSERIRFVTDVLTPKTTGLNKVREKYGNNVAAGVQTVGNMPVALNELGDTILKGASVNISEHVKYGASALKNKMFGTTNRDLYSVATNETDRQAWERKRYQPLVGEDYESVNTAVKSVAKLGGEYLPISKMGNLLIKPALGILKKALPVIAEKQIAKWTARASLWAVGGTAYTTAQGVIEKGELPTGKEALESGMYWGGMELMMGTIPYGIALNRTTKELATAYGIKPWEAVQAVYRQAKSTGEPMVRIAQQKAAAQKFFANMEEAKIVNNQFLHQLEQNLPTWLEARAKVSTDATAQGIQNATTSFNTERIALQDKWTKRFSGKDVTEKDTAQFKKEMGTLEKNYKQEVIYLKQQEKEAMAAAQKEGADALIKARKAAKEPYQMDISITDDGINIIQKIDPEMKLVFESANTFVKNVQSLIQKGEANKQKGLAQLQKDMNELTGKPITKYATGADEQKFVARGKQPVREKIETMDSGQTNLETPLGRFYERNRRLSNKYTFEERPPLEERGATELPDSRPDYPPYKPPLEVPEAPPDAPYQAKPGLWPPVKEVPESQGSAPLTIQQKRVIQKEAKKDLDELEKETKQAVAKVKKSKTMSKEKKNATLAEILEDSKETKAKVEKAVKEKITPKKVVKAVPPVAPQQPKQPPKQAPKETGANPLDVILKDEQPPAKINAPAPQGPTPGTARNLGTVPMHYPMPANGIRKGLQKKYPKGARSTADLVSNGDRTATTRQPFGKVGDIFKIQGAEGTYRITGVEKVDLSTAAGKKKWSEREGWDADYARKQFRNQVKTGATQTIFERIDKPATGDKLTTAFNLWKRKFEASALAAELSEKTPNRKPSRKESELMASMPPAEYSRLDIPERGGRYTEAEISQYQFFMNTIQEGLERFGLNMDDIAKMHKEIQRSPMHRAAVKSHDYIADRPNDLTPNKPPPTTVSKVSVEELSSDQWAWQKTRDAKKRQMVSPAAQKKTRQGLVPTIQDLVEKASDGIADVVKQAASLKVTIGESLRSSGPLWKPPVAPKKMSIYLIAQKQKQIGEIITKNIKLSDGYWANKPIGEKINYYREEFPKEFAAAQKQKIAPEEIVDIIEQRYREQLAHNLHQYYGVEPKMTSELLEQAHKKTGMFTPFDQRQPKDIVPARPPIDPKLAGQYLKESDVVVKIVNETKVAAPIKRDDLIFNIQPDPKYDGIFSITIHRGPKFVGSGKGTLNQVVGKANDVLRQVKGTPQATLMSHLKRESTIKPAESTAKAPVNKTVKRKDTPQNVTPAKNMHEVMNPEEWVKPELVFTKDKSSWRTIVNGKKVWIKYQSDKKNYSTRSYDGRISFETADLESAKTRLQSMSRAVHKNAGQSLDQIMGKNLYGVVAGVQQDENGDYYIDPYYAALGMVGGVAVKGLRGKKAVLHPEIINDPAYNAYRSSQAANIVRNKASASKAYDALRSGVWDVSGKAKEILRNINLPEGKRAIQRLVATLGANAEAMRVSGEHYKKIYKGLSSRMEDALDDFIMQTRVNEIWKYKPEKTQPGDITGPQAESYLRERFKQAHNLTDMEHAEIQKRGKEFFNSTKELLEAKRKAGLLSMEEFDTLSQYLYSPQRYLDYVIDKQSMYLGRTVNAAESKVKAFREGSTGPIETRSRLLLQQLTAGTYDIIFKNRATGSLYQLAKNNPENGIFRLAEEIGKTKQGKPIYQNPRASESVISSMVDGRRVDIIAPREFVDSWIKSDPLVQQMGSQVAQIIFGAKLVKAVATGYNPAFAFTNMPRDIALIWTGKQYNPILPVFLGQFTRDMAVVAKDVMKNEGRVADYIKEGGGMEFLSYYGRFKGEGYIGERLNSFASILGWVGAKSELWTRIAHRERALRNLQKKYVAKNGELPGDEERLLMQEEATMIAREGSIDFNQKGNVIKMLDDYIPYLNAGIQATRVFGRNIKESPVRVAFQMAQLMGVAALLNMWNGDHPGYAQVSPREKEQNFILMIPDVIPGVTSYTDDKGVKKYRHIKIAKENQQRILFTAVDAVFEAYRTGKVPKQEIFMAAADLIAFANTSVPSFSAALAYLANVDTFTYDLIWKGDRNVAPEEQIIPGRTSKLMQGIGEVTGMSPVKTSVMMSKIIPQSNPFVEAINLATEVYNGEFKDKLQSRSWNQIISEMPTVRRVVSTGNEANLYADSYQESEEQIATENHRINRLFDERVKKYLYKQDDESYQAVVEFHNQQEPEVKKRLTERYQKELSVQQSGDPNFFKNLLYAHPKTRARLMFERAVKMDAQQEAEFLERANKVKGFVTPAVIEEWKKLLAERQEAPQ